MLTARQMFRSKVFWLVWYLMMLWVAYRFILGNEAEKQWNIRYKDFKGRRARWYTIHQDKERFVRFVRVFGVMFLVFSTLLLIFVLLSDV